MTATKRMIKKVETKSLEFPHCWLAVYRPALSWKNQIPPDSIPRLFFCIALVRWFTVSQYASTFTVVLRSQNSTELSVEKRWPWACFNAGRSCLNLFGRGDDGSMMGRRTQIFMRFQPCGHVWQPTTWHSIYSPTFQSKLHRSQNAKLQEDHRQLYHGEATGFGELFSTFPIKSSLSATADRLQASLTYCILRQIQNGPYFKTQATYMKSIVLRFQTRSWDWPFKYCCGSNGYIPHST